VPLNFTGRPKKGHLIFDACFECGKKGLFHMKQIIIFYFYVNIYGMMVRGYNENQTDDNISAKVTFEDYEVRFLTLLPFESLQILIFKNCLNSPSVKTYIIY
jgi:hypothetical protein